MDTYEKKYNEALERAQKATRAGSDVAMDIVQYIFPELRESEDEMIRKEMIDFIQWAEDRGMTRHDYHQAKRPAVWIAYLEKQKYDRMKPIYDAKESFESALEKAWNDYHNGYENVDKLEDDYVECAHAKGFREGFLYGLEKQKEASKAIEAVDRIDKYIDDHLANAHDMKDSNPDKKYYRGWDDALGKMAGILQDVYSEKENKFAPRVLPCSAAWFEDGGEKQKSQMPIPEDTVLFNKGVAEGRRLEREDMMKDAVEGEVCGRVYDHINVRFADGVCKYLDPKNISHIPADVSKYNIGDKVRIIILKAEE